MDVHSGIGILGRQLLRQIIWETLNRHRPGDRPSIALIGSRRSGSTLLMQIIAQNRGVKFVNQPFSPYVATAHQMRFLSSSAGRKYIALIPGEEEELSQAAKLSRKPGPLQSLTIS